MDKSNEVLIDDIKFGKIVQSGLRNDCLVLLTKPHKIFLINFTLTFLKDQMPNYNHIFHS